MLKNIDLNTAELNEKVKRFKKYKKNELGWFQQFDNVNLDAGNCEINADAFNGGFGDGQAMGESFNDLDYSQRLNVMTDDQIADVISKGIDQFFPSTYLVYGPMKDVDYWDERETDVIYTLDSYNRVTEEDADGEAYDIMYVDVTAEAEGSHQHIELEIPLYDMTTVKDLMDWLKTETPELDLDIEYDREPDYDDYYESLNESVDNPLTLDKKFEFLKNHETYKGEHGVYYTKPCKVWDMKLSPEQEMTFYSYFDNGGLEDFWNKNVDLAHDIYQDGKNGGHLILDNKIIDPYTYVDAMDIDDIVANYLANDYESDIYGEYNSNDIDECKSLVKELIDKDYAILKDFDNRCDKLVELLKKELDSLKG